MDDSVKRLTRTSDPATSKDAAEKIVRSLPKTKARVLWLINHLRFSNRMDLDFNRGDLAITAQIDGSTSEELDNYDSITTSRYRTAIKHLADEKLIVTVGVRLSKYNRYQRVWNLTYKGTQKLKEIKNEYI